MFKKYFNLRKVVAIAICLAGVTMFSACGDDGDDKGGNNGGNNGGNFNSGMPSASVLADFGLTGLSLPTGVTDVEYQVESAGDVDALAINFKGYATNDNPCSAQFAADGWVLDEDSSWVEDTQSYWVYRKGDDQVFYGWGALTGSSIYVYKDYYKYN
ncbi:MAG: hypothetical protein LBR81_09810 [Prevotellaceae bacterium]|jgi:hypothetical protein|nr:hypothetical protein [Prevotellaceae bacterium]